MSKNKNRLLNRPNGLKMIYVTENKRLVKSFELQVTYEPDVKHAQISVTNRNSSSNSQMFFKVHLFFYNQPVYKQLALAWQIVKQLSGFNPISLGNNKNYRLKKSGIFPL